MACWESADKIFSWKIQLFTRLFSWIFVNWFTKYSDFYYHVFFSNSIPLDINECLTGAHTCNKTIQCENNDGSFKCICGDGFETINGTCTGKLCQR